MHICVVYFVAYLLLIFIKRGAEMNIVIEILESIINYLKVY